VTAIGANNMIKHSLLIELCPLAGNTKEGWGGPYKAANMKAKSILVSLWTKGQGREQSNSLPVPGLVYGVYVQ
jgi:hypothetical protein